MLRGFLWLLLLSLPLVLLPALLTLRAELQAGQARSWPQLPARVEQAQPVSHCSKICIHRLQLSYRYEAGGHAQQSGRLWFSDAGAADASELHALVTRYPVGAQILVHVDPQDPAQAVVQPRVPRHAWIQAAAPLLVWLLSFGVWGLLRWLGPQMDRPLR